VKLSAKLAEFERAEADLEDYKARAARATVDEDRALEDQQLSESEVAERISKAQNERNVYKARQTQREKAITALGAELASAINECSGELRLLVNREVIRRKRIITERVLAALEPVAGGARRQMALEQLLEFSGPVQLVMVLGPAPYIYTARDTGLDHTAKDILEKFEKMIAEGAKKI
jgi:hypothetical protein